MSDFRDRLNDFVRDHGDFTMAALALTILVLCAVTWLWGRQTKHLRRQLATERAANRAVLPGPSDAVMAVVATQAAGRELERAADAGNREVERSGRAVYSVARRPESAGEVAQPVAQDSLGWTLPPGAVGVAAEASSPNPAVELDDARDAAPDREPPDSDPPARHEATSADADTWILPASTALAGAEQVPAATTFAGADAGAEFVLDTPPAVAAGAPPAPEPHSAYLAWGAVTSEDAAGPNGPAARSDAVVYSAWERAVDMPQPAAVDDPSVPADTPDAFAAAVPEAAWARPAANGSGAAGAAAGADGWVAHESPPPVSPGPSPRPWAPAPPEGHGGPPPAVLFEPAPGLAPEPLPAQPTESTPVLPVWYQPVDASGSGSAADILLVEDDENVTRAYRLLLESKGFTVRSAADGVTGLDEARVRRPDLILLDVMMPRMNGILFLQALRTEPALESVPVVILSNFKEPRLVDRAMALGVLEYMVKAQTPPEAMLNAIPRWVRGERAFAG
jgi:CheY-like chemotaxis protein